MSSPLDHTSVLLVIFLSTTTGLMPAEGNSVSCPTWFSFNNDTQECECGGLEPWGIRCNQQEMKFEVANGYCVSYLSGLYYAGDCYYVHKGNFTDRVFSVMPDDPDKLNDVMCGSYNRKGLLCGECIDGYGPAVYLFDNLCVDCSKLSVAYAAILYLLLEFVPIFLFFIFVMVFHVNITTGPLLGYVFFCQVYVLSIQFKNVYVASSVLSHVSFPLRFLVYSSLALSGVWSLKFSWIFTPPFCISRHLTGIHTQLLELVPPIITLFILAGTGVLIDLHKRNCSPVVKGWRVIGCCLKKISLKPVDGNAVIHAFATFIFLSAYNLNYVAIVTVTHDPISYSDGNFYNYVVACDPTITWFGHKHIAYLSFMGASFLFLVLIPSLLLCVYPTRIYSSLSRIISTRKQLAIKTFAEALHPCFKDGLNGTRDYRALAGLSLIFCTVYSAVSFYVWNLSKSGYDYKVFSGLLLILLSMSVASWRPFKSLISNISVSYHTMSLGFLTIILHFWNTTHFDTETLELILIIAPLISHIYVLTWIRHSLIRQLLSHRPRICHCLRSNRYLVSFWT